MERTFVVLNFNISINVNVSLPEQRRDPHLHCSHVAPTHPFSRSLQSSFAENSNRVNLITLVFELQ